MSFWYFVTRFKFFRKWFIGFISLKVYIPKSLNYTKEYTKWYAITCFDHLEQLKITSRKKFCCSLSHCTAQQIRFDDDLFHYKLFHCQEAIRVITNNHNIVYKTFMNLIQFNYMISTYEYLIHYCKSPKSSCPGAP